jgi:2-haloacid dehalogenase
MMSAGNTIANRLQPKMMSFDVFGTLISVRDSSYGAFQHILDEVGAGNLDVRTF